MALTKIQSGSFEAGAINTTDLSSNVTTTYATYAALAGNLTPRITTVNVTNSTYFALDDTAVNTGGGYIVVTGANFQSGAVVIVDTTQATSTTFVSSTELRAQIPAKSAATYNLYVTNPDGGVGIKLNGVNYSASPIWSTTSPLPNVTSNTAFTGNLSATGATLYSNTTSLPSGLTLVSANGYYYGNISVGSDTTYSFTVNATDAENQDSSATFNLTVQAIILAPYLVKLYGAASGSTFTDSSSNNHTVTVTGSAITGSTTTKYGGTGTSIFFNNTTKGSDVLNVNISARNINVKSKNWYIGFWYYPLNNNQHQLVWLGYNTTYNYEIFSLYHTPNSDEFKFSWNGSSSSADRIYDSSVPAANSWRWISYYHAAGSSFIQSKIYDTNRSLLTTLYSAGGGQDWNRWGGHYAETNPVIDFLSFNKNNYVGTSYGMNGYVDSFIFTDTILTASDIPTMEPY